MAINYWNGGAWAAIPTAALMSTYRGTMHMEYPEVADRDGLGAPCGAVGRPTCIIRSPWMTDTGLDFWRDLFAAATDTYVAFDFECYDYRQDTTTKWTGYLCWPVFGSEGRGAAAASTVYRDVEIRIMQCTASSH